MLSSGSHRTSIGASLQVQLDSLRFDPQPGHRPEQLLLHSGLEGSETIIDWRMASERSSIWCWSIRNSGSASLGSDIAIPANISVSG